MPFKKIVAVMISLGLFFSLNLTAQSPFSSENDKVLTILHTISSHTLYDYVKELTSEKYAGRLTGTAEYQASAEWVASLLHEWRITPGGDDDSYFQFFTIPYTCVFEGCELYMHLPFKKSTIKKSYLYEDEFIPGATSGSGEITSDVVYVGYGITAPELNYDDYKEIEVEGKIVLMEREVPVSPQSNPEIFKEWRPYSFHQYKLMNAVEHGAKGMLYNYGPISNPNNSYVENFIYTHVGEAVVADLFSGSGRKHKEVIDKIKKKLKPQSFNTGKVVTIKNVTEYHPEGRGSNVIGILEGTDPVLKDEVIVIGAHLDHLGRCYETMPGANDNASAVAVLLGVAEALTKYPDKLKRSVMFLCFGAEEQAVLGSKIYLENPKIPLEKTIGFINMDGVGCGNKLSALAAENYPAFWKFFEDANNQYMHRIIETHYFINNARPRLDAARFMWKEIPTISFSTKGAKSYYHVTKDDISTITPEIMEDLAQLVYLTVIKIANEESVNFRESNGKKEMDMKKNAIPGEEK